MRLRSDGAAPGGVGTRRDSKTGLLGTTDEELLEIAGARDRLFATGDRISGRSEFPNRRRGAVNHQHVLPATRAAVHAELGEVLQLYCAPELTRAFIVVEPGGNRNRGPGAWSRFELSSVVLRCRIRHANPARRFLCCPIFNARAETIYAAVSREHPTLTKAVYGGRPRPSGRVLKPWPRPLRPVSRDSVRKGRNKPGLNRAIAERGWRKLSGIPNCPREQTFPLSNFPRQARNRTARAAEPGSGRENVSPVFLSRRLPRRTNGFPDFDSPRPKYAARRCLTRRSGTGFGACSVDFEPPQA